MIYLWMVNILVAALFFLLWLRWQKKIAAYALKESRKESSIYSLFVIPFMIGGIIVGLYLIPMVVSFIISYLTISYLGIGLVPYSPWSFYVPHLLVLGFCLIQFGMNGKNKSNRLLYCQ